MTFVNLQAVIMIIINKFCHWAELYKVIFYHLKRERQTSKWCEAWQLLASYLRPSSQLTLWVITSCLQTKSGQTCSGPIGNMKAVDRFLTKTTKDTQLNIFFVFFSWTAMRVLWCSFQSATAATAASTITPETSTCMPGTMATRPSTKWRHVGMTDSSESSFTSNITNNLSNHPLVVISASFASETGREDQSVKGFKCNCNFYGFYQQ